jgi:hypothetical protein
VAAAAHKSDSGGMVFDLEAAAARGRATAVAAVFRVLRRWRLKEERWRRLVLGFVGGGGGGSGGAAARSWKRPALISCGTLGGNEYPLGSRVACYIGVGKIPTVIVHMCTIRVEYYSIPYSTYYID